MAIIGTCINCLPASANVTVTMAFAIAFLAVAVYRTA